MCFLHQRLSYHLAFGIVAPAIEILSQRRGLVQHQVVAVRMPITAN